jgi:hypothetical protein
MVRRTRVARDEWTMRAVLTRTQIIKAPVEEVFGTVVDGGNLNFDVPHSVAGAVAKSICVAVAARWSP